MADLDLVLDKNKSTTMPTVGKVRRIKVPAGTRTFIFSSAIAFYWETPSTTKTDNADDTDADQLYMPPGLYDLAAGGTGLSENLKGVLAEDTFFYFVPTAAAQPISFRATTVG